MFSEGAKITKNACPTETSKHKHLILELSNRIYTQIGDFFIAEFFLIYFLEIFTFLVGAI